MNNYSENQSKNWRAKFNQTLQITVIIIIIKIQILRGSKYMHHVVWQRNSLDSTRTFPGGGAPNKAASWYRASLPTNKGSTQFNICHLSSDICCAHSKCTFSEEYISKISYPTPTTLLVFGHEGYSDFYFDEKHCCTVRKGDIWLISVNGQTLHRRTLANVHAEMSVVKYSTERINRAFDDSDEMSQLNQNNELLRLSRQQKQDPKIVEIFNNPMLNAVDRLIAEARALELIAFWLAPSQKQAAHAVTNSHAMNKRDIESVVTMLTADLANPPSLESLAQSLGVSHTCLNRNFRKALGKTVFEWLRSYRLERACHYLKSCEISITDIAFNCGFSSASHFSQCFKKHYGQSPAEFRQANAKRLSNAAAGI